ncbi:MAG: DUF4136 domain-containing protein [Pseudoxanthomonas sp.]
MKALQLCLLCCVLTVSLAPQQSAAREGSQPVSQVRVSKPATSLPGNRYAWVEMPPQVAVEFDKRAQDPQLRQRLQAALDKVLKAKGYSRIDDVRQADIVMAYRVGVRDAQQATVRESGSQLQRETAMECGPGGCSQIVTRGANGVPTIAVHTENITEGGLLVEVLQPGEIRVLWRALYRGSVRAKDGPVDLDTVAAQTLAQLPKAGRSPP